MSALYGRFLKTPNVLKPINSSFGRIKNKNKKCKKYNMYIQYFSFILDIATHNIPLLMMHNYRNYLTEYFLKHRDNCNVLLQKVE